MPRGSQAKSAVEAKLQEAFGKDYIGVFGGKYYIWADDGGEQVQIAIALTCPKTPVGEVNIGNVGGHNFSDDHKIVAAVPSTLTEITEEEQKNIADLIKALGL